MLGLLGGAVGCGVAEQAPAGDVASEAVVGNIHVRIGDVEGPAEYTFGDITSVTADAAGRIYVADRIGSSIRVFDTEGRFLTWLGREGEGPGEYQWPNDLTFDPLGRLWIRDANRITVLAPGHDSEVPDSVVTTYRLPGYGNLDSRRARADGQVYYSPAYLFTRGEPERYFYLPFDTAGFRGDTIPVPAMPTLGGTRSAYYMLTAGSGRMVDGLNRAPFEPSGSWDVTADGHVLSTTGLEYRVVETDRRGDTARVWSGRDGRRLVPPAERADSMAALQQRLDSLPVPIARVQGVSDWIRRGALPDSLPATTALHATGDGKIWVGRWPQAGAGERTVFDVFSHVGEFERTVVIPASLLTAPPPYLSDRIILGIIKDRVTDVQSVLVVTLER